MIEQGALPPWLPLLQKPCEEILGSRKSWELRVPGGASVYVERGAQGYNNILFHIRYEGAEYACKLFFADERRRAEREWAALKAVQAAGFDLAPEPIAFANAGPLPQPAIVCSWIQGATLAGQPPDAKLDVPMSSLISACALMHGTPAAPGLPFLPAYHQPAGYAAYLDEARGFLAQVEAWAGGLGHDEPAALPAWAADLPALLPLLREALRMGDAAAAAASPAGDHSQAALVRIDGNLANVIRQPDGRLAFIDWEYSGVGDPAYDLAELRWHPRALAVVPQQAWDRALAGYPVPAGDPGFCERLAVYGRLLPAWWTARTAAHLLDGIEGAPSSRRRMVRLPARLFRGARRQLDVYLAALGLIEAPEAEEGEED